MATLYENYITGDTDSRGLGLNDWVAQTFTPSISHTVTSVKLKLWRGLCGTVTVSIRATDAGGKPTGADLASGTIAQATITTVSPGAWYEVLLGDGTALIASTKYAIVVRAPNANTDSSLQWRIDTTGAYTGGGEETSADSGVTWTTEVPNFDLMFFDNSMLFFSF